MNINHDKSLTNLLIGLCALIWSILGLAILVLLAIAVFGSNTWVENLNISPEPSTAQTEAVPQEQQAPPQQQPQQPTQAQLDCVAQELGEERLAALEQGEQPTQEESAAIQTCLQN